MSSLLDWINNWISESEPARVELPGLVLRWTGFKASVDHSMLAGQWLAIPTTQETREAFHKLPSPGWQGGGEVGEGVVGVYSSTPGAVNPYKRGDHFDVCPQSEQIMLQVSDFEGEDGPDLAIAAYRNARQRLEAYLRQHGILLDV